MAAVPSLIDISSTGHTRWQVPQPLQASVTSMLTPSTGMIEPGQTCLMALMFERKLQQHSQQKHTVRKRLNLGMPKSIESTIR